MKKLTSEKISEISSKYGDSFYILDSDAFIINCCNLMNAFRKYYDKTNIAYSYKTNYIPKLGRLINQIGGFAEVVSDMELEISRRIGVNPEKIIWNGPIKNMDIVERFLLLGGTVNVDNIYELTEIVEIANNHANKMLNIGIRCNYDIGDGVISRFGFDVNGHDFEEALLSIVGCGNLCLKSIHGHFANRNLKYWSEKTIYPEYLDLGGGLFGEMPQTMLEQLGVEKFSLDEYAYKSAKLVGDFFQNKEKKPYLFVEPGTSVVADCMGYVCRVESIKEIRGKIIVTTNGSQKNINNSGINPPIEVISMGKGRKTVKNADIAGYTCIESDYLYKNFCGEIAVGDFIVFENCGSYSVVMKPPFILPNVPIIDIGFDTIEEIKRKEQFEDLFSTYVF